MNLLLTAINTKYIHSNLAIYSLRAAAGPARDHIQLAEYTINQMKDQILQDLYRRRPDVLFFSVYIWNLDYVEEISSEFHKLCPDIPIWVGGPEVSYEVETFLKEHPWITGVIIGEGEATFRDICEFYLHFVCNGNNIISQIPGIAYRSEDDTILFTTSRLPVDLSSLPFAYEDLTDFENRIIYYESSRGCPFSCSYCLSSVDKRLRFRKLDLVEKELQFFLDKKVPQVKFVDRTFNCKHDHAMAVWKYIAGHDNGITNFHFEISADLLRPEELELIASMRPGLIQLEIGVQSTNEETIHEIHRSMDLDKLKKTVLSIESVDNIHQHLDLIAGLPYEDYDTFRRSFNEIYALKPNQLQMGFLKVLKGSYMYEHAEEYGCIYHARPPYEVMATRWLSYDDVLSLKLIEEMLEVHYNSGQFEITMKLLEVLYESPFDLYRELGEFYLEKGYFQMSHSRLKRCQILLEFLKDRFPEDPALFPLFKEALTYDLYYRENCKTRPAWAPDPASYKSLTRACCPNGRMNHLEPFHYRFPDKKTRTISALPHYEEEPIWILFSYDRRDPLDHQAHIEEILPESITTPHR